MSKKSPLASPAPAIQAQLADARFVDLAVPEAVCQRVDLAEGITVQLNGAGTPVGLIFPYGIDGLYVEDY